MSVFINKEVLKKEFAKELDKFEGVFSMDTNPRDFKRIGKMVITLNGVPKEVKQRHKIIGGDGT